MCNIAMCGTTYKQFVSVFLTSILWLITWDPIKAGEYNQ